MPLKVDAIVKQTFDTVGQCIMDTVSIWRDKSLLVRLLEVIAPAGLAKLYIKFATSSTSRDRATTATAPLFFEDLAKVKNVALDREIVDKAIDSIKFAVNCHDACAGDVWN